MIDLNELPDEELNSAHWSNIMLMLMKHISSRNLLNMIKLIKDNLKNIYENEGKNYIFTSMYYVLSAGNLEKIEDLADILNSVSSDMGGDVMTIAERLITQGITQGIMQGREEGIAQGMNKGLSEGILQGIQKTALNMLREGVDLDVIFRVTGLTQEEIRQLQEKNVETIS